MRSFAALGLVGILVFTVGCGDPVGTVSGVVTVDGSPKANLVVSFTPVQGGASAAGTTDAEGKYTLNSATAAGLPPGNYKVSVTTSMTVDDDGGEDPYAGGSDSAAYESAAQGDDYSTAKQFKETIPAKYNKASTLQEDVVAGANEINFQLDSK